jgi:uncharacterized membrane protein YdcZ (DUF606 family)
MVGLRGYAVGGRLIGAARPRSPRSRPFGGRGGTHRAWSGGLFSAIFIGPAIFLVPLLGAATFIALLVTGQMLASVTFDHFG